MIKLAIDPTKPIFASRNAGRDSGLHRDEDLAMAHQHWGPFTTADEARSALAEAMRAEAEWIDGSTTLADRHAALLAGADAVADGAERVVVDGLVWKIANHAW